MCGASEALFAPLGGLKILLFYSLLSEVSHVFCVCLSSAHGKGAVRWQ